MRWRSIYSPHSKNKPLGKFCALHGQTIVQFVVRPPRRLSAVIKCIYLSQTYLHFIQDVEDRCLLLTSSMSFVDLPF
jgi:hypothetical protein